MDDGQTQVMSAEPTMQMSGAGATMTLERPKCPVCQAEGTPGEQYCPECGFLLSGEMGAAEEVADLSQRPKLSWAKTGQEIILREGENSVGRDSSDVLLADSTVSRRHAVITSGTDGISVTDIGSTNGTFVNGSRLSPNAPLGVTTGDEITFGGVTVTLAIPGVEAPAEKTSVAESRAQNETPPENAWAELSATDGSARYYLAKDESFVGRREGDILITDDAYVSGRHCVIRKTDGGMKVEDVGSSNGTYVNGERLAANTPHILEESDLLKIGQREWRLVLTSPSEVSGSSEKSSETATDTEETSKPGPAGEEESE